LRHLLALLALPALLALLPLAGAQDDADPVLLRVGEQVTTAAELERRFEIAVRSLAANQGIALDDDLRAQLRSFLPQFLEQRATEVVLLQEASARGIAVPDAEVDAVLEQIRASVLPGQTYEQLLAEAGFGDEAFLRALVAEAETINLLVETLRSEVEVDDGSIEAAYEANAASFAVPEQVCARHILLESEADAQLALSDLVAGADFALLAADRSVGPSGPNGGELGCFGRGQMVAPFEETAFAAEVDIPAGPVQTQFGYHLILVYDRQEAGTAPLEQVRDVLEQQVRDEAFATSIEALREAADVELFPERLAIAQPAGEGENEGGE
jgi:peptidyl-prolyl cis-trans isomerase C